MGQAWRTNGGGRERSMMRKMDKESKDNTAGRKLLAFGHPQELSAQYLLPKENLLGQAVLHMDRMDFIVGI